MSVRILLLPEKKRQEVELPKGADGFALLRQINMNPENVIIVRGDEPIPVDARIKPGDDLKIIRVVSGG